MRRHGKHGCEEVLFHRSNLPQCWDYGASTLFRFGSLGICVVALIYGMGLQKLADSTAAYGLFHEDS
jgi:hypothetical protein